MNDRMQTPISRPGRGRLRITTAAIALASILAFAGSADAAKTLKMANKKIVMYKGIGGVAIGQSPRGAARKWTGAPCISSHAWRACRWRGSPITHEGSAKYNLHRSRKTKKWSVVGVELSRMSNVPGERIPGDGRLIPNIPLTGPLANLTTNKGIGLGSTLEAVQAAYPGGITGFCPHPVYSLHTKHRNLSFSFWDFAVPPEWNTYIPVVLTVRMTTSSFPADSCNRTKIG